MALTWSNGLIRFLVVIGTSLAATAGCLFAFLILSHLAMGGMWLSDGTLWVMGRTTVKTNIWLAQALVLPAWLAAELSAWLRKKPFPAWSYVLFLGVFWFGMAVTVVAQTESAMPNQWLVGYGLANLAGLVPAAAFWWFAHRKRMASQSVPDVF